ncbi:hypothetical protein AB0A74_00640 [Saccharothrix sp. NPDC042600]|uniref:hypothetical protein n=1 Tax=Saccharothrix TaxID=2071 RepID=UPI0033C6C0D8|nr:hypothetical protein GCM10017745_48160 [Saccharothrix mutabilis subsp. capreolus]
MADGFVHLYQTEWSVVRAALRISSLAVAGVMLANPNTKKIHSLEWDDQRDTLVPIDEDVLMRWLALADRDEVSFNFWFDANTDLCYRVRRVTSEVVVEEFSLDGFGGPRYELGQDKVIRLVIDEMHRTGPAVVGLVADRWGTSLEMDIDDAVITGMTPVTIYPELLILRPEVADRHPELRDWGPRPYGEFTAFDPTRILDRW